MRLNLLAAALIAATGLVGCTTRPVVVEAPPPPPPPMPMPSPMPPPVQMSLHDRVHMALQDGMGSAASDITVRVDGSTVYLTGHVATKADHERAHDIAHDVPGVSTVDHSGLVVH